MRLALTRESGGLHLRVSDNGTGLSGLTKSGAGTWNVIALNTYTGVTTIAGGNLNAATIANINTASSIGAGSVAGAAADLVLDGGNLQYTGAIPASTDRPYTLASTGGFDASGRPNVTHNLRDGG